jgi:hypothetical protein
MTPLLYGPCGRARQLAKALLCGLLALSGFAGATIPNPTQVPTQGPSGAARTGVFYFPGWKDGSLGNAYARPWEPIKAFPERQPLLGWYDEGRDSVMAQHLSWMRDHGIGYVVFDYYWRGEEHQQPLMDHALRAYMRVKAGKGVQFAIMWANHDKRPKQGRDFYELFAHWLQVYLRDPDYLRIDGKPVVFVMLGEELDIRARMFGSSARQLLDRAQIMARQAGLPGIFFVAGAGPGTETVQGGGTRMGYSAYFAYNHHTGPAGRIGNEQRESHTYAELDQAYRVTWQWFMSGKADLPYIVSLTSGWDRRPWGGSGDRRHDNSVATPAAFKQHLQAGKSILQRYPQYTVGLSVICCWNEFGEGSYIEPTRGNGMGFLEAVRDVFGTPAAPVASTRSSGATARLSQQPQPSAAKTAVGAKPAGAEGLRMTVR